MSRCIYLATVISLVLMASGCTSNGSGTAELTAEQKTAVEQTAARVVSSTQTLAAGLPAVDRVDTNEDADASVCPAISLELVDSALTLALDYGTGCSAANQGNAFISGALAITGNSVTRTLDFTYDELSIDDRTVDGAINLTFMPAAAATTVNAAYDVRASDHGRATGDAVVSVDFVTRQMTMTTGTLTFVNLDDETSTAVAENLFYDPVLYGNFIPAGGTITFEVLNDATPAGDDTIDIVVTFDEQSPVTRTVSVTVGRVDAGTVTLPDIAPQS